MVPSEQPPDAWMQRLTPRCGGIRQHRWLSCRAGRAVVLVEDEAGERRVFKLRWGVSLEDGQRMLEVLPLIERLGASAGLMPILGFGLEEDLAWLEMPVADAVEGWDGLFEHYSPRTILPVLPGTYSATDVAAVGLQLVGALMALASVGLHHGDVKPGNLIAWRGAWLLSDFDTVGRTSDSAVATASTQGYLPPGGPGEHGRDAYALGKVLYELWTGNSRLEYPSMPRGMLANRLWDRRDRLLNRSVHALCAPLGAQRLRDPARLKPVLEAIVSGEPKAIARAGAMLSAPRARLMPGLAIVVLLVMSVVSVVWFVRRLPRGSFAGDLDGHGIVWTPYQSKAGVNAGYVRKAFDHGGHSWLLFNAHGTMGRPLVPGDRVDVELKKDVWRGHVALYLSDKPFHQAGPVDFGHRENFGGLEHLMWFHLDGDRLSPPTLFRRGNLETLFSEAWTNRVVTNTLSTHHVTLWVDGDGYRWQVLVGASVLFEGEYRGGFHPAHLGIYAFDNTLCYLTDLRIENDGGGIGVSR